ncbi:MAG TPA: DoxX family protein [Ktedonobacteraceae bacterium]
MSTLSLRRETRMNMKVIGYWAGTAAVAGELLVGGVASLLRGRTMLVGKPLVQTMERLGYPAYLLTILGVWKPLGGIALLAPRFPRLKEWAYAGTFFEMIGAVASHVACGDDVGAIWPLLFAVLTLTSWALRPQSRTLAVLFPASDNQATNAG